MLSSLRPPPLLLGKAGVGTGERGLCIKADGCPSTADTCWVSRQCCWALRSITLPPVEGLWGAFSWLLKDFIFLDENMSLVRNNLGWLHSQSPNNFVALGKLLVVVKVKWNNTCNVYCTVPRTSKGDQLVLDLPSFPVNCKIHSFVHHTLVRIYYMEGITGWVCEGPKT